MTSTLEPSTAAARDPFQTYEQRLQTLSEASVEQHFDAFVDIDWDDPDFAIDPTDERWILPDIDVLGRPPVVPVAARSPSRSGSGSTARPTSPRSACSSSRSSSPG